MGGFPFAEVLVYVLNLATASLPSPPPLLSSPPLPSPPLPSPPFLPLGVDTVIVKSGRRICGTGGALANAPLVQNKSYFEVKIQSGGVLVGVSAGVLVGVSAGVLCGCICRCVVGVSAGVLCGCICRCVVGVSGGVLCGCVCRCVVWVCLEVCCVSVSAGVLLGQILKYCLCGKGVETYSRH